MRNLLIYLVLLIIVNINYLLSSNNQNLIMLYNHNPEYGIFNPDSVVTDTTKSNKIVNNIVYKITVKKIFSLLKFL